MPTIDELEARLAELEARLGPVPQAVPPITIGSIADAPQPGSPVASNWANEVTNRIVHRFATAASRDSAWPASTAGVGSVCITLDTNTMWIVSNAAAWIAIAPLPVGRVFWGKGTGDQSGIFAQTFLGGLATTGLWTAVAGRRYKATVKLEITQTVATDVWVLKLVNQNTSLQLQRTTGQNNTTAACTVGLSYVSEVSIPGAADWRVTLERASGTGLLTAGMGAVAYPGFLLIEDIGPVP